MMSAIADIEEYFEVEEEERRKEEAASWSWDEMMKRMEELEAREASGSTFGHDDEAEEKSRAPPDSATQAAELKAKGNTAFARRKFRESVQLYSQAIALEPSSHVRRFRTRQDFLCFAAELGDHFSHLLYRCWWV